MRLRHVIADEGDKLRELRLRSLREDPDAFGSTHERELDLPGDWWTSRAALSDTGEEQRIFVIVDDADRWHGMALARADDEAPGEAVLNAMWIAPEARGGGHGTRLAEACADWAASRGFAAITVAVVVGNEAARRTYEAAGFVAHHTGTWSREGRTFEELVLRRPL